MTGPSITIVDHPHPCRSSYRARHSGTLIAIFALLSCLPVYVNAALKFVHSDGSLGDQFPTTPILLMDGEDSATVTVLYNGPTPASATIQPVDNSNQGLWSAGTVTESRTHTGKIHQPNQHWINYTLPFNFDQGVGTAKWSFIVTHSDGTSESVSGEFIVAGLVILENNKIVSGTQNAGVSVPTYSDLLKTSEVRKYDVQAVGVQGAAIGDLSAAQFSVRDQVTGVDMKQVSNVQFTSDGKFQIVFGEYRLGSGKVIISIEVPDIQLDGETYENVLHVTMDSSAVPPPVVIPLQTSDTNGLLSVAMFNLLQPPAPKPFQSCSLTAGSNVIPFEASMSKLIQPDQTIAFKTGSYSGPASVICDGRTAVVLGDAGASQFEIASNGSITLQPLATPLANTSGNLATALIQPALGNKDGQTVMSSVLRVVPGNPDTYTIESANSMLDSVCFYTNGTTCTLVNLSRGSAVLNVENYVPTANAQNSLSDLDSSVKSCRFQSRVGLQCSDLQLSQSTLLSPQALAPTHTAGSGGTPTYVPIVAGILGGLALILAIVGSVWFIRRRRSDRTESNMSSSGPVGVPDPDNVLYQQAIVRDIYGRGDFSGGGPTPEAAELRRKESELRDIAPQQPASVLSGQHMPPSEGASSTYSV